MEQGSRIPKLAASTGSTFSVPGDTPSQDQARDDHSSPSSSFNDQINPTLGDSDHSNYFKSIQWSPDGTCLFTSSADHTIRTFVAPPDLLTNASTQPLTPYTTFSSPEPVYALTPYPLFNHTDPVTTLLLSSVRDHPLRLSNIHIHPSSDSNPIIATYPLLSETTETYLTPSSLLFLPSGTHFLTGTDSLIALFDTSRSGEGPTTRLPTIPSKRHKIKGGGVGMRGIVSSLSLQPSSAETASSSSLLAAGTWTRWLGLYDAEGQGGTVATWSVAQAADKDAKIGGAGISQTAWSSCGRYLIVAERKSRGMLVYDVRVTGKVVQYLVGREAETNQRLGMDVFPGGVDGGEEVWAGGTDGRVKVWRRVGLGEGALEPEWEWQAHEPGTAVSGAAVHYSGTVLATSSGHRKIPEVAYDESEAEENGNVRPGNEPEIDNSVKLWNLL